MYKNSIVRDRSLLDINSDNASSCLSHTTPTPSLCGNL